MFDATNVKIYIYTYKILNEDLNVDLKLSKSFVEEKEEKSIQDNNNGHSCEEFPPSGRVEHKNVYTISACDKKGKRAKFTD